MVPTPAPQDTDIEHIHVPRFKYISPSNGKIDDEIKKSIMEGFEKFVGQALMSECYHRDHFLKWERFGQW